jgi:hypothetical protein
MFLLFFFCSPFVDIKTPDAGLEVSSAFAE